MKKVLFVATVVKTHIMQFHLPYLNMFRERGWETSVAARNDYEDPAACVIPYCDHYYDIPFERDPLRSGNWRAYKRLKALIEENGYDIIHCHTPVGAAVARLAARRARRRGTRVIYTAHGFHFCSGAPMIDWMLYYPAERWLARYTDVLITINREDYDRARRFGAGQVRFIPGVGVDLAKFRADSGASAADRDGIRDELAIPPDGFLILSVGEVTGRKNHRVVIEALGKLRDPGVFYVICGQGPLLEECRSLAERSGVEGNVIFTGYRTDVARIFRGADAFVFPSRREGLPVALIEAMASGLPVIATDVRGSRDLVTGRARGVLLAPDDIDGFAEAIAGYRDPKERRDAAEINPEVVKPYDMERVMKEYASVYFGDEIQ